VALQSAQVSPAAETTKTFTFNKPVASYGKGLGITIASIVGTLAPYFSADVDNGDGTMTGTVHFGATVTGTVDVQIYDRQ
jgi:hypothetical protein